MRKEVKLGMAIGGGLIALLVVYLLVAPPANNKKGTQLVGGQSIIDPQSGDPGPAVDDKTTAAKPTNDAAAGAPNTAGNPNPPIVQTEASKQPEAPKAADDKGKAAPAPGAGGGDQWKILQTGKGTKPLVQTTTPSGNQVDKEPSKRLEKREPVTLAEGRAAPQPVNPEPKLYYNPNDAWGGGVNTPDTAFGTIAHNTKSALSTGGGGSAAQGGGSPGTHVVREGETFSSIAQTVYGSAAYYPHLIRANPDVNPNNLKLGAVIKVPRIDEVKATAGEHAAAGDKAPASATEPKIDTSKQYRVVANDSLYKISLKLYGKSTYVDKLYEKNKAAIGPDPKKLKLGMVLDLPDKTTVAAGEVADQTNSTVIQGPGAGDEQSR